jgi:hypothetical protein
MEHLIVNPKHAELFARQGWNGFPALFTHFFPGYVRRRKMLVKRITIPTSEGEIDAFFKLYHHEGSGWSFWGRPSKARREFENYAVFERLGLPAAERIACGEERAASGRLQRAFIITRAVPQALEFDEFFRAAPDAAQRRQVLTDLADIVRRLHAARFYYYDLVWRNILVSLVVPGQPRPYLIDCPRGGFARLGRERKRLRDLASLDKTASQLCSRPERLRFLLQYLGKSRLDEEARRMVHACLAYRRKRWPEDWMGK